MENAHRTDAIPLELSQDVLDEILAPAAKRAAENQANFKKRRSEQQASDEEGAPGSKAGRK